MKVRYINGIQSLAARCNFIPTDWDMEAYLRAFEKVGYEKGIEAIQIALMSCRGNSPMPSPMDLLALVGIKIPEPVTSRDHGVDIANKIIDAVAKFGGYQAVAAKAHLGEDAWRVVEGMGGWNNLCMMEIDDVAAYRAQIRESADVALKKSHFTAIGSGSTNADVQKLISAQTTGMNLQ